MKLYFNDINGNKRYLEYNAKSRRELAQKMGGAVFTYDNRNYSVLDVKAEKGTSSVVPAVLGGALGMIGGGVGVAIGAAIGAIAGESMVETEKKEVHEFNQSTL